MPIKTFTAGSVLTAADTNSFLTNGGLVYIGATTLNAVTNNISNVFSSTYDGYRVVVSDFSNGSTTTRSIVLRFRTSSDDTSANYFSYQQFFYGTNQTGTSSTNAQTSATLMAISAGGNTGASVVLDIVNPNLAKATTYTGTTVGIQSDIGSVYVGRIVGGGINTATQYTGFSIIGATDNLSGIVRVYGYRQA